MQQSEGREPDIISLGKEQGDPIHSYHLHPVRPAEQNTNALTDCRRADMGTIVGGQAEHVSDGGAYSFARSACSFFGKICSMAPLSSKIGYDVHILAARSIDCHTTCHRVWGMDRRLEVAINKWQMA